MSGELKWPGLETKVDPRLWEDMYRNDNYGSEWCVQMTWYVNYLFSKVNCNNNNVFICEYRL